LNVLLHIGIFTYNDEVYLQRCTS